jgi:sugar transferase (PEP-CTERM/EpsH1 system associated)
MSLMEPLLLLIHRIPYPPNKGDKVRSWNLLKYLAQRFSVSLGTFVDDPADLAHVPVLEGLARDTHVGRISPKLARLRSLSGFVTGEALSIPYYRDTAMSDWVRRTVAERGIRKALVFSSQMAQYVDGLELERVVIDFVDVDSDKWRQYSETRAWPMSAIFRREARLLGRFESRIAEAATASLFVTQSEADLFLRTNPTLATKTHALANGVDTDFFRPDSGRSSPYPAGERAIVFTGAMDYWPNIDAVTWFARESLPLILQAEPQARFHIVGSRPTPAVTGLAGPHVRVHADVPDIRPYLQHADLAVVPMRLGRGIQNKILEAMAMERPTIVSSACVASLSARVGEEVVAARSAAAFAEESVRILAGSSRDMATRARTRVIADYSWGRNLAALDPILGTPGLPRGEGRELALEAGS